MSAQQQQRPKLPQVKVQLVGGSGNAYAILGAVLRAMRRAGVDEQQREAYRAEATAGDYDHLLATTMQWVDVQ